MKQPFSDANGDGIWEGQVLLDNSGAYEFKLPLTIGQDKNNFITDECNSRSFRTIFNRSLLVGAEATYGRYV
ncbi:MAG: hypothetical protein IPN79_10765 [Saprospiraceae bacterium]|nr:hypothetical protein [Saprospiraceae bacterium]